MDNNGYLPRKAFYVTITILVGVTMTVMGGLTTMVLNTQQTFNHNFTEVTNDISGIKTDIQWIKDSLK